MTTTTSFRSDLLQLISTSLDTTSRSTRHTLLQSITGELQETKECRVLLGKVALGIIGRCASQHAYKRLCEVLRVAIVAESSSTDGDDNNLQPLCYALCMLLSSSGNIGLLNDCSTTFLATVKSNDLFDKFVSIATQEQSNDANVDIIYPALSLALSTKEGGGGEVAIKLMDLFISTTFPSNNVFPTSVQLTMATPFLSNTTQTSFNDQLASTVGLKLRAHPDKVLPLVEVICSSLVTSNKAVTIDASSQLGDGDGSANLLSSVMKHLKSAKVEMRTGAWHTLILLAQLDGEGKSVELVTRAICDALTAKGVGGLATSDLRVGAYAAFEGIGRYVLQSIAKFLNDEEKVATIGKLANDVLITLTSSLPKDKNATVSNNAGGTSFVAKEVGINALLLWMQIGKKSNSTEAGYDKALDYLSEPTLKYNVKDGEFRFRIGSLIAPHSPTAYLSSIAGIDSSIILGGETFIESVLTDLMETKKIQNGLEAVVDAAVKKHASSDVVPQVDGVLAIYVLTLYKSSTTSKFVLSASSSKTIAAGSTIKGHETSFLYSPSLLESAKSDALLNYILHRTIALETKAVSKSSEGGGAVKGDQPLVRIIGKRLEDGHDHPYSAATRALSVCVANPQPLSTPPATNSNAYSSVHQSIKTIVTYSPVTANAADAILFAVFVHVNELSEKNETSKWSLNDTREKREQFDPVDETYNKLPATTASCGTKSRGRRSNNTSHQGYDPASIRYLANLLMASSSCGITNSDALWRAVILSHAGTTKRSNRRQRVALVSHMLDKITDVLLPFTEKSESGDSNGDGLVDEFAQFIAICAASSTLDKQSDEKEGEVNEPQDKVTPVRKGLKVSSSINMAATSLMNTLGGIAGSFDMEFDDAEDEEKKPYAFASKLCTQKLPAHLVSHLTKALKVVESLTDKDMALFSSPKGVLFDDVAGDGAASSTAKTSTVEKKKGRKKGGGFNTFEDEEWERQVKKDLEKKKKAQGGDTSTSSSEKALTPQQKESLNAQTRRRDEISSVLNVNFPRSLASIRSLCESDIEVGNQCLPIFGTCVISAAISTCAAVTSMSVLKNDTLETLSALASCVYEIDEMHAPTMARALVISFQGSQKEIALKVSALPSPCASAACSIFEMEDYGDCLSGNSFGFLFPIIRAALIGQRNISGCDDALKVLERHCSMLAGDEEDAVVKALRREMASTVLELLLHDRCQTFTNPTPYEALISCFVTNENETDSPSLTTPEIAPLLGELGALGNDNTRVASMETLASIAQHHAKLVKTNPLVQNRIWINCFEKKDRIKNAARKTWLIAHGHDADDVVNTPLDPPSKMYAVPLLPLFSHEDASIASAAAASFASAMGMNPETAEKNIVKLCNTYIASFPAPGNEDVEQPKKASPSPFPVQPPPVAKKTTKKKVIDTGLPTKKKKKVSAVSGSMAKITGAPAPRKSAATKKLLAKTVAPKKERTLDQGSLMDQFKPQSTTEKKKVAAEEDSESKVAIRMGVIHAIQSLTDSSANVNLDLSLLKILIGFLMAFGLGDGNEAVRNASRNGARDIIAQYGSSDEAIALFLPQFETVLKTGQVDVKCVDPLSPEKVPTTVAASDYRKEGVVVSLGSIALHLKNDSDEDKIDSIIDMLIDSLSTPSEDVQSSVALCLSKLMKKGRTQERIETLLNDLMSECIDGSSLASRRGAAYGISAAVKGSGIASLKKYEVVKRLEEACTSGSPNAKEGSLFCIELLSGRLGILFEPYVIVLLPALLKAFSDSNDYVRGQADKTVGLIMGNLSGHGVKLVMPAVLDAFNEPEWRTKQASIHMLGR